MMHCVRDNKILKYRKRKYYVSRVIIVRDIVYTDTLYGPVARNYLDMKIYMCIHYFLRFLDSTSTTFGSVYQRG